jgi:hypothetical protein
MTGGIDPVTTPAMISTRWQAIGPAGRALYEDDPARFVVLQMRWNVWDWLWIGGEPHRRARLVWAPDGRLQADWITP